MRVCVSVCVWERESDRQTERERERDRQTHTERERERERGRRLRRTMHATISTNRLKTVGIKNLTVVAKASPWWVGDLALGLYPVDQVPMHQTLVNL